MVERGMLSGDEHARLVRDHLRHIVVEALSWREGTFRFENTPLPGQESIRLDWCVPDAILEEARRTSDERGLLESVGGLDSSLVVARQGGTLPQGLNNIQCRILSSVDGRRTVPEIASAAQAPEAVTLRTLAGLVRACCLVAPPPAKARQQPAAAKAAVATQATPTTEARPAGRYAKKGPDRSERSRPQQRAWVMPEKLRTERAAILALADQLGSLDHYQILGVRPCDPSKVIREAFNQQARLFHPDRRMEPGLGNLGDELERVYHALRIAGQTLENAESRAEYDGHRERDHRAAEEIRQAAQESAKTYLHTACRLIERGLLQDAIPVLREALRSGPDCALAHYRLGHCLAASAKEPDKARYHFERAARIEPENARYRAALEALRPGDPAQGDKLAERMARWLRS
jgi:tetratricopeptide (TPR) repeat protein